MIKLNKNDMKRLAKAMHPKDNFDVAVNKMKANYEVVVLNRGNKKTYNVKETLLK